MVDKPNLKNTINKSVICQDPYHTAIIGTVMVRGPLPADLGIQIYHYYYYRTLESGDRDPYGIQVGVMNNIIDPCVSSSQPSPSGQPW